jgi:hypothetical protein
MSDDDDEIETTPHPDPRQSTAELLMKWHRGLEEIRDEFGRL